MGANLLTGSNVALTGGTIDGISLGQTTSIPHLNLGASLGYAGVTPSNSMYSISSSDNLFGSSSYTSGVGPVRFVISGDTVNYSGNSEVTTLYVQHNYGGPGTKGGRSAVIAELTQSAPDDVSVPAPGPPHMAVASTMRVNVSDNGTASNPSGTYEPLYGLMQTNPAATNLGGVGGLEIDLNIVSGSSTANKQGIGVYSSSLDAVQGSQVDTAYGVFENPASGFAGFRAGLQFGGPAYAFPIDPTNGYLITVVPQVTNGGVPASPFKSVSAAGGIDLHMLETSVAAYSAPGFRVDKTGSVIVGNGKLGANPAGVVLDVPMQSVTSATVHGGASGGTCFTGDKLYGPNWGIYTVVSVNGAHQATAVTSDFADVSSSPPANPITMSGTNCQNVSVDLTWSTTNTLTLNPSGGDVTIGSGAAAAIAATTGFVRLPFTNGTPSGTPANTSGPACQWNSITHTLNCYDGTGWYHITASPGAG